MENEKIKGEKRILKISICGTITFVLAEVICAILTRSMALLMDCVYDGTDLLMAIPFLILIPRLYKPLTEHRPYGYSQVESFFLLIKYSALLFLTLMLVKESVETIIEGGNPVSAGAIAIFEICVSAGCLAMMLLLRGLAKENMTPTIKAELFLWKLSALSTLGVGVAFIINIFMSHGSLAWVCPYVDPAVAIICAIFLLREPVQMIIESVRNLILFAPKKEVMDKVEAIAKEKCEKYGFESTFCEVIKTGRRYWINVYYYPNAKAVDLDILNALDAELEAALEDEFEDVWLEMIMDLLEYRDEKKKRKAK
ncbi:MAG: cation diffusion facilitator family transporter [Bacillota bacterium]|nr:cation diffusion facilitator family transporter [Bacillota bacterium]